MSSSGRHAADRPTRGQQQLALLAFCSVGLAALAAWVLGEWGVSGPGCTVRTVVGVPCPGCGGFRAALALAQADPGAAFRWNPLISVGLVTVSAAGFVAPFWLARGRALPNLRAGLPGWVLPLLLSLVSLNWIYLVLAGR